MLLYIIRHGDPDYSTDSLTPKGILQAEAVGQRMKEIGLDRIFSSPMGRARQTAEPACRLLGLPCEIEHWTHEVGKEKNTIINDKPVSLVDLPGPRFLENGSWHLNVSDTFDCPAFEHTRMPEVYKFIHDNGRDFLERLGYREENGVYRILRPNEDKVALFCHGFFSRTWLSILLNIPLHITMGCFSTTHTGVTILRFENYSDGFTAPRLLSYHDMSHLHVAGLDTSYNGKVEL